MTLRKRSWPVQSCFFTSDCVWEKVFSGQSESTQEKSNLVTTQKLLHHPALFLRAWFISSPHSCWPSYSSQKLELLWSKLKSRCTTQEILISFTHSHSAVLLCPNNQERVGVKRLIQRHSDVRTQENLRSEGPTSRLVDDHSIYWTTDSRIYL